MNSDPVRAKAIKSYWAAVQEWSDPQGLSKEEVHSRLKEIMGFESLSKLKTSKIMEMAFEISTMTHGGPGL